MRRAGTALVSRCKTVFIVLYPLAQEFVAHLLIEIDSNHRRPPIQLPPATNLPALDKADLPPYRLERRWLYSREGRAASRSEGFSS